MRFRPDGFLLGMVAAAALAWLWPAPGATGGALRPELLTKSGVALLFFLHGLALSFGALRAGILHWRLHLLAQGCVFVLFPLLGLVLYRALAGHLAEPLRIGLFFLCAAPSTVSSSVAMTAAAQGNVAGSVFNATASSLLGIVLTPLWVAAVLGAAGETRPLGPVIWDLVRWLLLPLAAGQALRPWWGAWLAARKAKIGYVDRGVILFLVYTSFCDSFQEGVWSRQGPGALALVVALSLAVLAAMLGAASAVARLAGLAREDRIALVFCGSKKSLAAGVPMAKLIFGAHPALGMILLPLMVYHTVQLVAGGMLARRWGEEQ